PAAVGRTVRINDHPMTIVGVAPAGFHGVEVGEAVDVYVPLSMEPLLLPTWPNTGERTTLTSWRVVWLTPMARLRHGGSLEQAQATLNVLYGQLLQQDLATVRTPSVRFRAQFLQKRLELLPGGRGTSGLRDQSKTPLLVLMGMVGLVLLIACANVA